MAGVTITGSGRFLPGEPVHNDALARVMETNDAWIYQRTGIRNRHYCREGMGVGALAVPAAQRAIANAGLEPTDIDYVLFNTMTPDHLFPGSGPLLTAALGLGPVPALDLRAQCAAMLYSFQLADSLLAAGAAQRILVIGAENHASLMPWIDWDILSGERDGPPAPEAWARANRYRGFSILFGDGAGALVLERAERECGIIATDIHSDGTLAAELLIPAGFTRRPYARQEDLDQERFIPRMNGREVFRNAITKLPESIQCVCRRAGVDLSEVDWFIGHQANARINQVVRARLGVEEAKMPSNIENYGNTSSATIPILIDELRQRSEIQAGQLVCVFALGAGLHWGSVLLRA